ncbi:hypothetical protein XENTR_v10005540 [Xenopus tropicalis]|nr:hypothetical protein XENTR_v10005540 [Xenopus tropicalis]
MVICTSRRSQIWSLIISTNSLLSVIFLNAFTNTKVQRHHSCALPLLCSLCIQKYHSLDTPVYLKIISQTCWHKLDFHCNLSIAFPFPRKLRANLF